MAFNFLCVVVDQSNQKSLAEYEVTAHNEPFARYKAAKMFKEGNSNLDVEWAVDVLQI